MKNLNLLFLIPIIISALYSCNGTTKQAKNSNTTAGDSLPRYNTDTSLKDPADTAANYPTTFALKAGAGGMMEVELGNLAQQNAQNQRVKNFGAMMVKDHTKANKELTALTGKNNITIPSKYPAKIQEHIDEMKKLKGADFDKHYMSMMTDDHKEDIDLFEKGAKDLRVPSLKDFAARTLPVLHMHLDSAKAIKGDLK